MRNFCDHVDYVQGIPKEAFKTMSMRRNIFSSKIYDSTFKVLPAVIRGISKTDQRSIVEPAAFSHTAIAVALTCVCERLQRVNIVGNFDFFSSS